MRSKKQSSSPWLALIVIALIVAGAAYWYWHTLDRAQNGAEGYPPLPSPAQSVGEAPAPPPSEPQYPAPEDPAPDVAGAPAAPSPDGGDASTLEALGNLFGQDSLPYFVPSNLIRRFVITVDNLPERNLPTRVRLMARVPGDVEVMQDQGKTYWSAANAQRYAPLVSMLTMVETRTLVDAYYHHYKLFQSAYAELGYGNRYFNDRFIAVIDHLLAAPVMTMPAEIVKPKVGYEFVDPALEGLSIGQKMMWRLGPEQQSVVKDKLRDLRAQIVARSRSKPRTTP